MTDDTPTAEALDKCYHMVGRFMFEWAVLEHELNHVIGTMLEIREIPNAIVCANLPVHAKINIARCLLPFCAVPNKKRSRYEKSLNRTFALSGIRNIIAHHVFYPSTDGTVIKFFVLRAKEKAELPDVSMTHQSIAQHIKSMRLTTMRFRDLRHDMKSVKFNAAMAQFIRNSAPNATSFVLGGADASTLGPPPSPEVQQLGSLLAILEKLRQTQEASSRESPPP